MCGALGLVALYSGLASGQMGVVAPVAVLVSASIPVAVGIVKVGVLPGQQLVGFTFAFIAVWYLSRGNSSHPVRLRDLKLPVTAGIEFDVFFILSDQVSSVLII